MSDQPDILTCSCCGRGIENTPEQNVSYCEVPYPHDTGFGMCRECGGTSTHETTLRDLVDKTDKQIEELIGWASWTFYSARFDRVRSSLKEENREKWDSYPTYKKIIFVQEMIEKGHMI